LAVAVKEAPFVGHVVYRHTVDESAEVGWIYIWSVRCGAQGEEVLVHADFTFPPILDEKRRRMLRVSELSYWFRCLEFPTMPMLQLKFMTDASKLPSMKRMVLRVAHNILE
jgi:hypothetical protein